MKRSCPWAPVLALAVLLSACGGPPAGPSGGSIDPTAVYTPTPPPTETPEPAPSPSESAPPTPEPTPTPYAFQWERAAPEDRGMDGDTLTALHDTYESSSILACLVCRDGTIVDEYYRDGYGRETVFPLHSCSKSITGALIGIAIDQGYIEGVDVPISAYFPQLLDRDDERPGRITIRHLLTHTSSFTGTDDGDWYTWRASENWVEDMLSRPVTAEPGTEFRYFTGNTHLLSAILQQATGKTVYEYGREVLLDPVGMSTARCGTDAQGIGDGGNGFTMTAEDMARFGLLFLHGGVWGDRQIVPAGWAAESTALHIDTPSDDDYGWQWWLRTFQGHQSYYAQGWGGQFIFVVPDLDLIVVYTTDANNNYRVFWRAMDKIVAAAE